MRAYIALFWAGLGAGLAAGWLAATRAVRPDALLAASLIGLAALSGLVLLLHRRGERFLAQVRPLLRRPLPLPRPAGPEGASEALPPTGISLVGLYSLLKASPKAYAALAEVLQLPARPRALARRRLDALAADPGQWEQGLSELRRRTGAFPLPGTSAHLEVREGSEPPALPPAGEPPADGPAPPGPPPSWRPLAEDDPPFVPGLVVPVGGLASATISLIDSSRRVARGQLGTGRPSPRAAADGLTTPLAPPAALGGSRLVVFLVPGLHGWFPVALSGGLVAALTAPLLTKVNRRFRAGWPDDARTELLTTLARLGRLVARPRLWPEILRRTAGPAEDAARATAAALARRVPAWRRLLLPRLQDAFVLEHGAYLEEKVLSVRLQTERLALRLADLATEGRWAAVGELVYLNQRFLCPNDDEELTHLLRRVQAAMDELERETRRLRSQGSAEVPAGQDSEEGSREEIRPRPVGSRGRGRPRRRGHGGAAPAGS